MNTEEIFTLRELKQFLCDRGVNIPKDSTVIRTTVYELKEQGLLHRCGRGEYRKADIDAIIARAACTENIAKATDMMNTVFDFLDNVDWKKLTRKEHSELKRVWQDLNELHNKMGARISILA